MPLDFVGETAVCDGDTVVEDALPLLEFLQSQGSAKVDLGSCTHLHTAVLQVLLAGRPEIIALPQEAFLARWLPAILGQPSTVSP
jgi:hypothetical protein